MNFTTERMIAHSLEKGCLVFDSENMQKFGIEIICEPNEYGLFVQTYNPHALSDTNYCLCAFDPSSGLFHILYTSFAESSQEIMEWRALLTENLNRFVTDDQKENVYKVNLDREWNRDYVKEELKLYAQDEMGLEVEVSVVL